MTARDAGSNAAPPPAPPGPGFLRRHPILAAFGVLAALSLFASYWPASAVITGVIVAGRATGADRAAFGVARRLAARVVRRLVRQPAAPEPGPPSATAPAPAPPSAGPPSPEPVAPVPVAPGPPATRGPARRRPAGARPVAARATRAAVAPGVERDRGL